MRVIITFLLVFKIISAKDASCGVVPMLQWGGVTSRRTENLNRPVDLVVIQHTVSRECTTDAECGSVARSIQSFQVEKLGFDDIGQSFLVGGNGKVYEGAGWAHVGAHTKGYNQRSIGISFVGDFRDKLPTTEALQAAQALIACGVNSGYLIEDYHLVGHQQLSPTISPGATLQGNIQTWPHWMKNIQELIHVCEDFFGYKNKNIFIIYLENNSSVRTQMFNAKTTLS